MEASLAVLQDLRLGIETRLIETKRRRNALLPINKLPDELTILILEYAVTAGSRLTVWTLLQVQWRWSTIMNSYPLFWNQFTVWDPANCVLTKLQKSGNASISIDLGDTTYTGEIDAMLLLEKLHCALPRWKVLTCSGTTQQPLHQPPSNLASFIYLSSTSRRRFQQRNWSTFA